MRSNLSGILITISLIIFSSVQSFGQSEWKTAWSSTVYSIEYSWGEGEYKTTYKYDLLYPKIEYSLSDFISTIGAGQLEWKFSFTAPDYVFIGDQKYMLSELPEVDKIGFLANIDNPLVGGREKVVYGVPAISMGSDKTSYQGWNQGFQWSRFFGVNSLKEAKEKLDQSGFPAVTAELRISSKLNNVENAIRRMVNEKKEADREKARQEKLANQNSQSSTGSSQGQNSNDNATGSTSNTGSSEYSSSESSSNSGYTQNNNTSGGYNQNSAAQNNAQNQNPGVNIQQYNSFESQVQSNSSYTYSNAMVDYEIFNNTEVDFSEIMDAQIAYREFKDGLKIDNTLTPQGMLSEYRQNLREIDAYYEAETKKAVAGIIAEGAKNSNVKGAGAVTAVAAAAAVAWRKEEEKREKKRLESEMESEFKKIQKELLEKEEPKVRTNQQKASGAVTIEQEDFYMGWRDYWSCRVNRIEKQFSIKNTDWIDPNCNTPRMETAPGGPSMQSATAEQLYEAAIRKKKSNHSFMNNAANSFLKAALKKDPKNSEYLFTAYLWSKGSRSITSKGTTSPRDGLALSATKTSSSSSYGSSRLDKSIDYLHKILSIDTKNAQAREALRYELAVKDRDRESYVSYVEKYPAGIYGAEARYAVSYFDNVNEVNDLISSGSLEQAADKEQQIQKSFPDFYRESDVKNRERLNEVYDERYWKRISSATYSGKYRQKIEKERTAYNSYLTEYPNGLHKEQALQRLEFLDAKLKADRTKLMYTASLANYTTIDGYANSTNGLAPYQYTGISFVNRLNMAVSKRIMLAHLGGNKFIGGFGRVDFTLMGNLAKKINTDIGAADFGDFSQFNPTMFYHSPPFNFSAGITITDLLEVYVIGRSRPEIGTSSKEDGKLFYEKDRLYDPRYNLDEPPFQPGFGARVQIPFDGEGKNYLAVRYETNTWKGDNYNSNYTLIEAKVVLFGALMIGAHSETYVPFVDGQGQFNLTARYLSFNVGADINMGMLMGAY